MKIHYTKAKMARIPDKGSILIHTKGKSKCFTDTDGKCQGICYFKNIPAANRREVQFLNSKSVKIDGRKYNIKKITIDEGKMDLKVKKSK